MSDKQACDDGYALGKMCNGWSHAPVAEGDKQSQRLATEPSRLGASHPRGPPLLAGCPMSSSRVKRGAQDIMWEEEGDTKDAAARGGDGNLTSLFIH